MPRLSRAQEAARRRIVDAAARGLSPGPLGARLLEAIELAIPSDGQRLWGVDPGPLLFNRLLAATPGDEAFRLRWLRGIYLAHGSVPYFNPPSAMRATLSVTLMHDRQDRCWGVPDALLGLVPSREHARVFHDALTPAGGYLRACFAVDGRWVATLDLVRRTADRPLQPTDAAFLRLVAPTIGRALVAALARERALADEARPAAPGASGVVVLDDARRLRYATPAGEAWLDLLWDAQREGHRPLPTAVWAAVAGLGADEPAHAVVVPTAAGSVRVEASPGGEDGSVAIVLAPVRPLDAPELPADWPLTPQERRVVTLLAQGLTDRQIAARLAASERTVEAHLGHAYEKLGVGSRTALLARLFQDRYLPALAPVISANGGEPGN